MLITKFNNWVQSSLRLLLTAFICGLLFVSNVFPAQAVTSKPSEGEANLNTIQERTDSLTLSEPTKTSNPNKRNPLTLEETAQRAKGGLNEVQGAADKDKMISSEDTDATSVTEQAKNFLRDLTK
jgi:hypothetical protein